jgi:hypothetical protein
MIKTAIKHFFQFLDREKGITKVHVSETCEENRKKCHLP